MERGHDIGRLTRVLGGADTRWIVTRVRERLARGLPTNGTISLSDPSRAERAAIDQLLGRRASTGSSVTVPLAKLDAALRDSGICADGLAAAVVTLTGPVTVRSDEQAARDDAWAGALEPLRELVSVRPELAAWYSNVVATGLIRRLAGTPETAGPLVEQLCAVLENLPADSDQLGPFAIRILGSAHALDDGNRLTTLMLSAARAIGGAPDGSGAGWRRMVLASVGLMRDELNSTVLTLGLLGDDASSTGRALRGWAADGQPAVLTLRQLRTDPPGWNGMKLVSVCENPSVVSAAADRLGTICSPLVCTSGQPGAAVLLLLEQLARAGTQLRYHGDFDWYGIAIANFLRRRFSWEPWRFEADNYLEAVHAHETHPLAGPVAVPSWDHALGDAMTNRGRQVEEEAVLDQLLSDLGIVDQC